VAGTARAVAASRYNLAEVNMALALYRTLVEVLTKVPRGRTHAGVPGPRYLRYRHRHAITGAHSVLLAVLVLVCVPLWYRRVRRPIGFADRLRLTELVSSLD
jgi:hypothetical protein